MRPNKLFFHCFINFGVWCTKLGPVLPTLILATVLGVIFAIVVAFGSLELESPPEDEQFPDLRTHQGAVRLYFEDVALMDYFIVSDTTISTSVITRTNLEEQYALFNGAFITISLPENDLIYRKVKVTKRDELYGFTVDRIMSEDEQASHRHIMTYRDFTSRDDYNPDEMHNGVLNVFLDGMLMRFYITRWEASDTLETKL